MVRQAAPQVEDAPRRRSTPMSARGKRAGAIFVEVSQGMRRMAPLDSLQATTTSGAFTVKITP